MFVFDILENVIDIFVIWFLIIFVSDHRAIIKRKNRSKNHNKGATTAEIEKIHHATFIEWFRAEVSRIKNSVLVNISI